MSHKCDITACPHKISICYNKIGSIRALTVVMFINITTVRALIEPVRLAVALVFRCHFMLL